MTTGPGPTIRQSSSRAAPVLARGGQPRLSALWLWLSVAAAALGAAGSVVGLLAGEAVYGRETAALADAATAQDIANLVLVLPLLAILSVRASRGSLTSYLAWLGCLAFSVYNFMIYAFSVHFGPLFPVWVGVLGLSVFALTGGLSTLPGDAAGAIFAGRSMTGVAWLLICVAVLFSVLWLSEIVPAIMSGASSASADDWAVPTNPVHVLDLAFFLPAVAATGVLLMRRHPLGYATVVGQLTWLALTCVPILLTPFVAHSRGHAPGWAVLLPIGVVLVVMVGALVGLLRTAVAQAGSSGRPPSQTPATRGTPGR